MAGSLSHIIGKDGTFRMGLIENLGDAHEALDECFKIIFELTGGKKEKINAAIQNCTHCTAIERDMKLGGDDAC